MVLCLGKRNGIDYARTHAEHTSWPIGYALAASWRPGESATATDQSDGSVELTSKGREVFDKLILRREADLEHMLRDWNPDEHPEVRSKLATLAKSFASSPPVRPWIY
jgi:hypothetical protein